MDFFDLVLGLLSNVHCLNLVRKASALAESYDAPRIWRVIVFLFVNLPWRHKESFISVRFTRHWWWPSTQFIERVRAMIQGWSGEVCFSDAPRWTRAQVCIATLFGSACLYNNISERFWDHIRALRYLQARFWFKLLCMIIDRGYIYVSYKEHYRQDRYQQNLLQDRTWKNSDGGRYR